MRVQSTRHERRELEESQAPTRAILTTSMPEEYNIGSGLSHGQLQAASFWVTHKLTLRRVGYGTLIGLGSVLWLYVLYVLVDAFLISYPRESRIPRTIVQLLIPDTVKDTLAPKELDLTEPLVLPTTGNRFNLLSSAENTNESWIATLTSHYLVGGVATEPRTSVLLPGSARWIGEFGYTPSSTASGSDASLVIDAVEWKRVRPDMIENDYASFRAKRMGLLANDISFLPEQRSATGTLAQAETRFILSNPTGFGFWSTELVVTLDTMGRTVAATRLILNNIKPGEDRPINIVWPEQLTNVTKTTVVPFVNILDPSVYLPTSRF